MKITIVESTLEHLRDDDYPTRVFAGHLSQDEMHGVMRVMGGTYPQSELIEDCGTWIGAFSNQDEVPLLDEDGCINSDVEAHLRLYFTHADVDHFGFTLGGSAMSLHDWSSLTQIKQTSPTTEKGAVSVVIDPVHPLRASLWSLDDYRVSSACGSVIWLIPKAN